MQIRLTFVLYLDVFRQSQQYQQLNNNNIVAVIRTIYITHEIRLSLTDQLTKPTGGTGQLIDSLLLVEIVVSSVKDWM